MVKESVDNYSKPSGFEELEVYKSAFTLASKTYQRTRNLRDYGLRDQIRRASVSIFSNIAEGYEKGYNKEFVRHLYIAKGSCGEVQSQLMLAKEIKLLDNELSCLIREYAVLSKRIGKLIQVRKQWNK